MRFIDAAALLAVLAIIAAGFQLSAQAVAPSPFRIERPPMPLPAARVDAYVRAPIAGDAHAVSAAELEDGRLAAFWFEGSSEGAPDVVLNTAYLDQDWQWSAPLKITDAAETGRDQRRYINTVGNSTVFRHPNGEFWLIYVTVSYGGWSFSSLNLSRSPDGVHWGPSKRLVTSPFLNLSTLVKAPPLIRADGLVALPAYHEFITTFPEMLLIAPDGSVRDKARMTGACRIQPWVTATDATHAIALMRNHTCPERRLWSARSADAGTSWEGPEPLPYPNPGAPAASVTLRDGRLVAVFNGETRRVMQLAVSRDAGETWQLRGPVFDGTADGRSYRYPWLMQDRGGRLHLLVTEYLPDGRQGIRHAVMGAALLDAAAPDD